MARGCRHRWRRLYEGGGSSAIPRHMVEWCERCGSLKTAWVASGGGVVVSTVSTPQAKRR